MKKFLAILLLLPSFAFPDEVETYLNERPIFAKATQRVVEYLPTFGAASGLLSQWEVVRTVLKTNITADAGGLRVSSVIYDRDGVIRVYYAGYTNSISGGVNTGGTVVGAFGPTWDELERYGTVIARGTNGTWDSGNIGSARIYRFDDSGTNYLYYFATTNTGFETGWQGCGVAYTTDGTNFTKYSGNPILNVGTNGTWDAVAIQGAQCVIKYLGRYYMFFSGKNAGGDESLGLAFADSPLGPWRKYTENPVLNVTGIAVEPNVFRLADGQGWGCLFGDGAYTQYAISPDLTNWTAQSTIYYDDPGFGIGDGQGAPGTGLSPFIFEDNGPAILLDDSATIFLLRPKQSQPMAKLRGWFYGNVEASSLYATNFLALRTNYVAANFAPETGFVKFVGSNNAVFAVSRTKTNLISAP